MQETGDTVLIHEARKIPWRRKQLCAPVFLPGKFHGQRSLAGDSPRGHKRVGRDWAGTHKAEYAWAFRKQTSSKEWEGPRFQSHRGPAESQMSLDLETSTTWKTGKSHKIFLVWRVYEFKKLCQRPPPGKCELLIRVQLFVTPWTVTLQAPLSMGFPRQEYRSGLPCLPPEDLPYLGIELNTRENGVPPQPRRQRLIGGQDAPHAAWDECPPPWLGSCQGTHMGDKRFIPFTEKHPLPRSQT